MLVNTKNFEVNTVEAFHAVSLFSNCGAGDVGYRKAGFEFDVMAELQPSRLEVCLLNHPTAVGVQGDLRETWTEVVAAYKKKARRAPLSLLAACPPCQGMSSARGLRGSHDDADAGSKDERNLLAVVIAKVATELKPKLIVVENVPEFLSKKVRHPETKTPITASNLLIELLADNYTVFPIVLDMCDFGIPQSRKRSFLTLVRNNQPGLRKLIRKRIVPYPAAQNSQLNLGDILREFALPPLDAANQLSATCTDIQFKYHFVPVMSPAVYSMVSAIPFNNGDSAWDNNTCNDCQTLNKTESVKCVQCNALLPKPLVRENSGHYRLVKGFKTSYKRMHLDRPSPTILTASSSVSSHNTIHPYENRVFSCLECMKLQTFENDFNWGQALEKYGISNIRKMIGEAVPPKFTEQHGAVLLQILNNTIESSLAIDDKRCASARDLLRLRQVVNPLFQ